MSRSIHANRSRRQLREFGYRDWAEIARKRDVKESVIRDRGDDPPAGAFVPVAAIPIRSIDKSPYLFFPASIDDMQVVLDRLPPGSLDGVSEVRLEAGTNYINAESDRFDIVDPFLRRKSLEEYPRIFTPMVLGKYVIRTQAIYVYGYAKAPKTIPTPRQQVALELETLTTLVHEFAHHFDRTRRLAQGRPWASCCQKAEEFAEALTIEWTLNVVVPYLCEKYGSLATARLPRLVRRPRRTKRWRQRG